MTTILSEYDRKRICSLDCGRYGWDVQPDGTCGPILESEYLGQYNSNFISEEGARVGWALLQILRVLHRPDHRMKQFPGDSEASRTVPNSPRLSRTPFEAFKAANRIEDVARGLTELRGTGNLLSGKCPLHGEVLGEAFKVWIDSQRWRCFGKCGTGGDVIDLIELAEGSGMRVR